MMVQTQGPVEDMVILEGGVDELPSSSSARHGTVAGQLTNLQQQIPNDLKTIASWLKQVSEKQLVIEGKLDQILSRNSEFNHILLNKDFEQLEGNNKPLINKVQKQGTEIEKLKSTIEQHNIAIEQLKSTIKQLKSADYEPSTGKVGKPDHIQQQKKTLPQTQKSNLYVNWDETHDIIQLHKYVELRPLYDIIKEWIYKDPPPMETEWNPISKKHKKTNELYKSIKDELNRSSNPNIINQFRRFPSYAMFYINVKAPVVKFYLDTILKYEGTNKDQFSSNLKRFQDIMDKALTEMSDVHSCDSFERIYKLRWVPSWAAGP